LIALLTSGSYALADSLLTGSKNHTGGDFVATLGNQWGHESKATINIETQRHHEDPVRMFRDNEMVIMEHVLEANREENKKKEEKSWPLRDCLPY